MRRIGVDVGGTNTDAVLVEDGTVRSAVKTPTTEDVTTGIRTGLAELFGKNPDNAAGVDAIMIGTTHFVNAVVQRKSLNRAAALRVCLPACATLEPMVDWPEDLSQIANGGHFLVHGGHEYDGRPITALDEKAVANAGRGMRNSGVTAAAVTAVFSPLTTECEDRAAEILLQEHPDLHITKSSALGRIGLLERENAALLNASLIDLSKKTIDAFQTAIAESGLNAPLYISQNDGTVVDAETARDQPVYSFASGPTNSMRGGAHLADIDEAIVIDVGGTTTDIGHLRSGYPREANNVVDIGGVRTLFRMPDLLSIGLGGGTVVTTDPVTIGPQSVAHRLTDEALVFGGVTTTMTDMAVAANLLELGDANRVEHIGRELARDIMAQAHQILWESVDRMKIDASPVPVLAVGGGAMLIPEHMDGISEVIQVQHFAVANAVGAAIGQISGEVDHIFRDMDRDAFLAAAEQMAYEQAALAGAAPESLKVVDVETIPLAYLPGRSVRVRLRVVGDLPS